MSLVKIDEKLLTWFVERWHRKSTLVLILFLTFMGLIYKFTNTDISELSLLEVIFILLILILIMLLWKIAIKLPKTPRNHFGICIAIYGDTAKQDKKIKTDFIKSLQTLLDSNNDIFKYSIIKLPKRISEKINSVDIAKKYMYLTKSHFIIYGHTRLRKINNQDTHLLNLDAVVTFKRAPKIITQHLDKEFGELFPRKLQIECNNDAFSFEFASEWISLVSRYIIGIALLISRNLDQAEKHFDYLINNPQIQNSNVPQLSKIRNRLPLRLGDIYWIRTLKHYTYWKNNHDMGEIDLMYNHLQKLRSACPKDYSGRLFYSIFEFLKHRDVDKAITELKKCKEIKDATWKYNLAFLYAYKGDLKRAKLIYKSAFKGVCDPNVVIQTEEFMEWLLEVEPDKIQMNYCLGLINWFDKGDYELAISYFEKFINSNTDNSFEEEKKLAKSYINTIKGEMVNKNV
ncbi:MAG: hypothetical protein APR54_11015 [Candidatus Cloacimonas sp. SDB]|nr:MAG: hypothetical protein APR54_11015 [Candidatus Cloacimonas sp. SDB]